MLSSKISLKLNSKTMTLSVLLICISLFSSEFPAIFKIGITKFLFGMSWKPSNNIFGIFLMIIGSIYVTIGALIVGVPLGITISIYGLLLS